jgi:hypothetical protein
LRGKGGTSAAKQNAVQKKLIKKVFYGDKNVWMGSLHHISDEEEGIIEED